MKNTRTLIILFLFVTALCQAQSNFVKGYIVNTQKDTLNGYIDYKEWNKSPLEITFKKELNQSITVYSVADLISFTIDSNQETYDVLDFNFEKLPRHLTKPLFSDLRTYAIRNKEIIAKKIFVRQISKGKINLYQFVDKDLDTQFIIKKKDEILPLVYHIIRIDNELTTLREYQIQLTNLIKDACQKLPIEKTEYTLNEMKGLIDTYNSCFGGSIKTQSMPKEKGKIEYGVLAGVSYSTLNYTYLAAYTNVVTTLKGTGNIMPVGGVFFNYVLARNRGKLAILNEINTYTVKSSVKGEDYYSHYNMQYLGMQNLIRYKIYVKKPSVYLLAGMSNGFLINNQSNLEKITTGVISTTSRIFRKHEQGLIGGLGLGFNKLMIETRYIRSNGFAATITNTTPTSRIELIMKLNLRK